MPFSSPLPKATLSHIQCFITHPRKRLASEGRKAGKDGTETTKAANQGRQKKQKNNGTKSYKMWLSQMSVCRHGNINN